MYKLLLTAFASTAIALGSTPRTPVKPVHPTNVIAQLIKQAGSLHKANPYGMYCGGWDNWSATTSGYIGLGYSTTPPTTPSPTCSATGYFAACTFTNVTTAGFEIDYTPDTTQTAGTISGSDGIGTSFTLTRDPTVIYAGYVSLFFSTGKGTQVNCPV